MKVEIIAPPPLRHDPYEEECTGAHAGDVIKITDHKTTILIKELKTGLGPIFNIEAEWEGQKCKGYIFVSDDGELMCQLNKQ